LTQLETTELTRVVLLHVMAARSVAFVVRCCSKLGPYLGLYFMAYFYTGPENVCAACDDLQRSPAMTPFDR